MDAWDATAFGNNSATEWLAEVIETADLVMINEAFDAVLSVGDGLVDLQAAEEAVAAADVVAWIGGRTGVSDENSEQIESWIDEYEIEIGEGDIKQALKVVDRVFNAPSELRDAWEESDEFGDWKKALADLKERLS